MEPTVQALKKALEKKESHVNVEYSDKVPEYVIHSETHVCGFFGSYRFLSNFWPCPNKVEYLNTEFTSVEHAYQAAKWPKEEHCRMINISAGQVKKLGRQAPLPHNWDTIKYKLMEDLVLQKFTRDENLKKLLLNTGNKILDERNSWGDVYWGTNTNGVGQNNLGKILMNIRSILSKYETIC